MVLRSIGVLSCGKLLGTLYAAIGLIIGALLALMSVAGVAIQQQANDGAAGLPAVLLGGAAIIILPIFYGILGFIGGIVASALYNMFAGIIGGIELNFETNSPDTRF